MKKIELELADEAINYLYEQAVGFTMMCPERTNPLYLSFKNIETKLKPFISQEHIEYMKDYVAEMAVNPSAMEELANTLLNAHTNIADNLNNPQNGFSI